MGGQGAQVKLREREHEREETVREEGHIDQKQGLVELARIPACNPLVRNREAIPGVDEKTRASSAVAVPRRRRCVSRQPVA